jgi:predicted Zn-dependent peptidase
MKKNILKKYENGLRCVFQKDDFNNICVVNIFFPINMGIETDKKGIGFFTSKMLLKGTKSLTIQEFSLELEKNAIFLNVERTNSYINFSLSFDKQLFHKAIDIFIDVLKNPRFQDIEIEKLKKEFINALTARFDDISTCCSDEFSKLIFGENNYKSWCNLGTKQDIENLTKTDLINFHKSNILTKAPIISIIGNLEYVDIESYFLSKFDCMDSVFPDSLRLLENDANNKNNQNNQKNKNIKKNFNQAYIMTGIFVPSIKEEHFTSLKLINNYLGYGMSSVFFDKIREEMGLVYEIGSYSTTYNSQNYWAVYLGLDKKNVDLALDAINGEIIKLCSKKITNEKFEILKLKTKRYEIFKQQKKATRCFYLGLYELLGLGYDYKDEYLKKIDAITLKEMDSAIDFLFKDKQKFTVTLL